MDGWGALTMLIKRQNAAKYRKAELRYKLQKKKEGFVHDAYDKDGEEFEFPKFSKLQMDTFKKEVRTEIRQQQLRSIGTYLLVILFIIGFVYLALWLNTNAS